MHALNHTHVYAITDKKTHAHAIIDNTDTCILLLTAE
jgi:hypothetical protein